MSTPRRRRWWQAAAMVVAGGLTVALTQNTTTAAFTGQTSDTANSVGTANSFCATPGGTTLIASADTTGYQTNPTTLYGASTDVGVGSASPSANGRVLVKFTLPALGNHCTITAATLRLYASSPAVGRTIDVYRVDPLGSWSEAATYWNNLPATTGTAVGSASLGVAGWQTWTVDTMVNAFYAGTNSGFLLRDRTENSASAAWQLWSARENVTVANRPQLVLTWG